MKRVLFIRPEGDQVGRTLSSWADRVRQALNFRPSDYPGIEVSDLSGGSVLRTAVEAAAKDSDLVLFYGHGSDTGLGDPPVLDTSNVTAAGKGVYVAAACSSANELAKAMVKEGVKAYIGYDDLLVVVTAGHPDPLGTAHKKGVVALLTGGTASEATVAISNEYRSIREKYLRKSDPDSAIIWLAAHGNLKTLTLVGNGAAVI